MQILNCFANHRQIGYKFDEQHLVETSFSPMELPETIKLSVKR